MWFAILGPLLVHDGEKQIDVPKGRQRVLLATLLMRAGKPVSVDALAEVVWDGSPPPGAAVTLRSYVLRLRRVLGPSAGTRLVTRLPGYLLQATDDEVDVARFRALCRDGGTAAREGAWARADGLLGEALDLWRGAPLADVPSDLLADGEVPSLEELRVQAHEWRADAGLHLGRHGELVPALQALTAQHPLRERFHAQLMLALYRCGRQADALSVYQHARHMLIDELGTEPGPDLRHLHQQVLSADPALAVDSSPPPAGGSVPMFPYRGLSAFGEQDAGLFFGREEATARVLELMSGCLDGAGLVIMSGVSGAGKSSLLHAGVLAELRRNGLAAAPEAASWPCLAFTPGRSPVQELAVRIAPLVGADAASLQRQLAADPAGFARTVRRAAQAADGPDAEHRRVVAAGMAGAGHRRVVLLVDQCEQLFTACRSQPERQAFLTALLAAAAGDDGGQPAALVVLAVRADFEARLADFPRLAAAVQDRYLLTAMTRRQLRLAITQPAAAAGCGVQEDLVQVLLEEAGARTTGPPSPGAARAGALPLLSHALDQAWRGRARQQLTLTDYERAGGIDGAVAASAQRAYQALTPAQQDAARQVFTGLAVPGSDGTDTALPAARADLTAGLSAAQAADVEVVLEKFAAQRLLTLDAGTVAVSHEVLLTAWPLLRDDWLAQARADRITRTRLHATVTEWAQASRDPAYLYTGSRLDAAAAAAARISADSRQLPLSQADHEFLHASHRAGRRRARTRQRFTAALLALIAALTAVTIMAIRTGQAATAQRNAAAAQRDIAVSSLLIGQSEADASTDATTSRLDAIAAFGLDPSAQARYALLSAAANPQIATVFTGTAGVVSVAFSANGKILATGRSDGLVRLWNVASGGEYGKPIPVGSAPVGMQGPGARLRGVTVPVAFSPDGKTLAAVEPYGVQLIDMTTLQPDGGPFAVVGATAVAFSPDGKNLAIGGPNAVQLWNVSTGQPAGKDFAVAGATAVAYSPDGKAMAIGGPSAVRLWNATTGQPAGKTFAVAGANAVAFSPDGSILAISGPNAVQLWNVSTGQPACMPLTDGGSPVDALAFSPNGKTLATGGLDGTARLWDLDETAFRQFGSPDASVSGMSMAFSPDGTRLASASATGSPPDLSAVVQLLNVATGHQIDRSLTVGPLRTWALAFGPGRATTLATSSASGVRLRDIASPRQVGMPYATPDRHAITAIALSRDGQTLAVSRADGTAQLWDVTTRLQTGGVSAGPSEAAVFSPDLRTLATIGNNDITLWDMSSDIRIGTLPDPFGPVGDYPVLVFSPNSNTLAVIGYNGITLWNVANGQQIGRLITTPGQPVITAALSPDGKTLATGSQDGVTQLWDMATGLRIGHDFTSAGPVEAVAFSPDGKTLAIGSQGTTQLWDVSYLADPLAELCGRAGGSLTPADWARYVQAGTPYRNACPHAGAR